MSINITEEELQAMKDTIATLNERIEELENKPKSRDVLPRIVEKPIDGLYLGTYRENHLSYSSFCGSTWDLFLKLGKELVKKQLRFHEERTKYNSEIRFEDNHREIKNQRILLSELDDVSHQAIVDMLNEICPIYNKYFKKLHNSSYVSFIGSDEPYEIKIGESPDEVRKRVKRDSND